MFPHCIAKMSVSCEGKLGTIGQHASMPARHYAQPPVSVSSQNIARVAAAQP